MRETLRAETVKVPPCGIASRALTAMLTSASSNSATSTSTGQMSAGMSTTNAMLPRSELPSMARMASIRCCEIDRHRIERLAAREGQELAREALAAPRRRQDGLDPLQRLRLGQPAAQHFGVAADDHQEIVEVVRDAAGELAERLHLLHLRELLARALERDSRPRAAR